MRYDSSPNHVKINVNKTLNQMLVGFYRRRMVTILPVSPFSALPLIEFLPGPSRHQLHRPCNGIPIAMVSEQDMDVVRGHHVIEHAQAIALPRLK
jgi:hypothetical protein